MLVSTVSKTLSQLHAESCTYMCLCMQRCSPSWAFDICCWWHPAELNRGSVHWPHLSANSGVFPFPLLQSISCNIIWGRGRGGTQTNRQEWFLHKQVKVVRRVWVAHQREKSMRHCRWFWCFMQPWQHAHRWHCCSSLDNFGEEELEWICSVQMWRSW